MAKFGAIDIGTNSVRLLIQEKNGPRGAKRLISTRLGEGLAATGILCEAAMQRTLDAVKTLLAEAVAAGCKLPVFCYATSAAREARNGQVFLERLQNLEGLSCEILDGETEALCAYLGAGAIHGAVMDIGGGSTELIALRDGKLYSQSITMGCVTALERFVHHDPPLAEELQALRVSCDQYAQELAANVLSAPVNELIGVGGTATQLAMLELGLDTYQPNQVHGYAMSYETVLHLHQRLTGMSDTERKQLRGMDPRRSDIIMIGSAISLCMLRAAGAQTLIASDADGLDGFLKIKCQEG